MNPSKELGADRRLVSMILKAIEARSSEQLQRYEAEFREIQNGLLQGDHRARHRLSALLVNDSETLQEAARLLAAETLAFVQSEMQRFKDIKSRRPLTEAEKRYGNECLGSLLDALERLYSGGTGSNDDS